jgi:hypothetical protein
MKKLLSLILAGALLVGAMFALTSCFGPKPELDLEKAEEALKDADYTVYFDDDMDEGPYVAQLEARDEDGNSLEIYEFESLKFAKLYEKQLKLEAEYELESKKLQIKAMKLTLKEYGDDLDDDAIEEMEEYIDELEKELEESEFVVGRKGKVVWAGTKEAIKASK